ncbi:MAG TPA: hypothetical protein VN706_11955 [Gemmatimonadaceae bacterium]|nr:hypothetical protein [Gemmatimonadaceae bacterium]
MNHRQGSTINTLHAIETFLDANELFAPLKDSVARKNIDAAITALDRFGALQSGGRQAARLETANRRNLRLALRIYHMDAIEHAARIALPNSPDLAELSVPRGKVSAQQLLKAAAGMSEAGTTHSATLIAAGVPANFVAELDAAAAALAASLAERNGHQNRRTVGTAGLKNAEQGAMKAIRLIDTQVRPLIDRAKDASLLAGWNAAKKIAAKPGLPRGAVGAAAGVDAGTQQTQTASTGAASASPDAVMHPAA